MRDGGDLWVGHAQVFYPPPPPARHNDGVRPSLLLSFALVGCAIPQPPAPPEALFETQGPPVRIAELDASGRRLGVREVFAVVKNDAGWRRVLTPAQFQVLRRGVTEPPDPAADREPFADGLYRCAGCETALFDARDRFASGSGWPSFSRPVAPENVSSRWDRSWGLRRRQVVCARCGGALGHVFRDGPEPPYLRYCINGSALRFYDRR